MPSARKIGDLIGVAPSTGLAYQRRLAEQANGEPTASTPASDDEPTERALARTGTN